MQFDSCREELMTQCIRLGLARRGYTKIFSLVLYAGGPGGKRGFKTPNSHVALPLTRMHEKDGAKILSLQFATDYCNYNSQLLQAPRHANRDVHKGGRIV